MAGEVCSGICWKMGDGTNGAGYKGKSEKE